MVAAKILGAWILGMVSATAYAGVCNYRPSAVAGAVTSAAAGTLSAVTAATGAGMKAAGLYTLQHSITGATMVGSTAAGSSGAGTIGIISGTAGWIGTAAEVVMATPVIVVASVAAAGLGAFEGACYLTDD